MSISHDGRKEITKLAPNNTSLDVLDLKKNTAMNMMNNAMMNHKK